MSRGNSKTKVIKLLRRNVVQKDRSPAEIIALAQGFNRARKPMEVILEYLDHRISSIGGKLSNMEEMHNKPSAGQYALSLLAQQTAYLEMYKLLSEFDVDQTEE